MIRTLAKKFNREFDWYVAITRGGLVPCCLLSKLTGMQQIDTFCINSYVEGQQRDPRMSLKSFSHLHGQSVLIVDDLVDSGDTMMLAVMTIRKLGSPTLIQTATLFKKDGSSFTPDYFVHAVPANEWLIFPWEVNETIPQGKTRTITWELLN